MSEHRPFSDIAWILHLMVTATEIDNADIANNTYTECIECGYLENIYKQVRQKYEYAKKMYKAIYGKPFEENRIIPDRNWEEHFAQVAEAILPKI